MRSLFLIGLAMLALASTPPGHAAESSQAATAGSVDLRPEFVRLGLERRQQADRPTCSVFTMTAALEFALAQREGHGARLSVEFLNWAGNQEGRGAADGGFFSDLWKGFEAHGICIEQALPYRATFDPARTPGVAAFAEATNRLSAGVKLHWIKQWNVRTGLSEAQMTAIEGALEHGWPVCGGFRWPKHEAWTNGVLRMCPPEAVFDGHSVLLVGFHRDPAQPGGGVFLFRNTAGDGRDGAMPYDYARAYLNDVAWIESGRSAASKR